MSKKRIRTQSSRVGLLNSIVNKYNSVSSYLNNTNKICKERMDKCEDSLLALGKEIEELKEDILANPPRSIEVEEEESGGRRELAKTHILYSWLFSQITCISQENPHTVASDMRDLLSASYRPMILLPLVEEGEEEYIIPESFYLARPKDFADFILSGRSLLKVFLSETDSFLNIPERWEEYSSRVSSWLSNEGLPLLYGAKDERWVYSEPMTYGEYYNELHDYVITADSYAIGGIVDTSSIKNFLP